MSSEFQFYSNSPSKAAVSHPIGDETLIKANWESTPPPPSSGTPIEKIIGQEKSQILFQSPLLTPSGCRRLDALSKIEATLASKLSDERTALEAALAASPSADSDTNSCHKDQIELSKAKIDELESKLRRTRHTLASLQDAQTDLNRSAGKVKAAQQAIQQNQTSPQPDFQTSLRNQLHEATGMMSTAARRVEQMESITDLLLEQLATKEGEVVHLQSEIANLTHQHTALVNKLEAERGTLIDRLEAAAGLASEYQHQQCELQAKLQQAETQAASKSKQHSRQLKTATDSLKKENDKLSKDLAELKASQETLMKEVRAKEAELATALEVAKNQGTPKGEGAKKVLPMAFQRIKETQQELQGEKEEAAFAKKEAELARKELDELSANMSAHVAALETEKERAVAEKQASLESMTRAAAAAAREAAVQAEAVLALKNDLEALSAERANLEDQLANFNGVHAALVAELDRVNVALESSEAEKEPLATALSVVELQLEEATATQQALKQELEAKEQAIAAGKAEITELKAKLDSLAADIENNANENTNANQEMMASYTATIQNLEKQVSDLTSEKDVVIRQMDRRDMIIEEFQIAVDTANAALQEANDSSAQAAKQAELKIKSLETDISMLKQEKEAREAEEERLRAELDALAAELQVKESAIAQARAAGTPVGEGAKQVLKLSFKKIQDMHQQMAEQAQTIATCDQTIAELRSALKERRALTGSLQSRLDSATTEASKAIEKLNQDMSRALQSVEEHKATAEAAQKDLAAAKESNARLLNEMNINVGGLQRELEAAATALSLKQEAMSALQSELDSVKASGTPQGNAAKEVVQLSFQKIRGLQDTIEHQAETIQELETRIDCAEDNASQLASQLLEEKAILKEVEKQYIEAAEHVAKVEKELIMAKQEAAAAVVRAEQAEEAVLQAEKKAQEQNASSSTELQEALDHANDELDIATIQAKQAQHRALALEEELANTQQLLTEAQSAICSLKQLEQTVEAQTRMVERLRIDVQSEMTAKQNAQELGEILKLRVKELESEISSLQGTITHLGEAVSTADETFKAAESAQEKTESEWLEALAVAGRDREEAMAAKSALEARISVLESQLETAKAEIESAKAAPTPKGEAAKTVSRLALIRVKELQVALEEREAAAKQAEDRAAAVTGELQRATAKLADLQQTANEKAAEAEKLTAEAKQKNAELEQLKARAKNADQLQLALATAKKEAAELAALKAASTAGLNKDMSALQSRIARLEAQLHEANTEKSVFEARAMEAQAALDEIQHLQQVEEALRIAEAVSTEASAKATQALEQRDELAARCAQLNAELDRSRKQMVEQGALLRRVSEALGLQRETNTASKELAATKEKELVRLLSRRETQVGKLHAELSVVRKKNENMSRLEIEKEALSIRLQQVESKMKAMEASISTETTQHSNELRKQRNALKVSREECFTLRMQLKETHEKLAKLSDKEGKDEKKKGNNKKKKGAVGHPLPEAIIAIALVIVGSIFWRTSSNSSSK